MTETLPGSRLRLSASALMTGRRSWRLSEIRDVEIVAEPPRLLLRAAGVSSALGVVALPVSELLRRSGFRSSWSEPLTACAAAALFLGIAILVTAGERYCLRILTREGAIEVARSGDHQLIVFLAAQIIAATGAAGTERQLSPTRLDPSATR